MGISKKWGGGWWSLDQVPAGGGGAWPGGRKAALQLREPAGLRPGSAGLRGPSASRALGLSLGEMLDSHGQGEAWRGSAVLCETLAPAGWLPFPSDLPGSADQQAGCSR